MRMALPSPGPITRQADPLFFGFTLCRIEPAMLTRSTPLSTSWATGRAGAHGHDLGRSRRDTSQKIGITRLSTTRLSSAYGSPEDVAACQSSSRDLL